MKQAVEVELVVGKCACMQRDVEFGLVEPPSVTVPRRLMEHHYCVKRAQQIRMSVMCAVYTSVSWEKEPLSDTVKYSMIPEKHQKDSDNEIRLSGHQDRSWLLSVEGEAGAEFMEQGRMSWYVNFRYA